MSDFTKEIPKELLHKTNEFGGIYKALDKMKNDVKGIIQNVGNISKQVEYISIFQYLYIYAK
ncbi:hypothetical protein [Clostridium algidicarnis]|uniref:hypothetical protein n=1 Tax=Clostridium algidicarnis TaxID=37659 RepID=UPI001C0E6641|nr:hypothetical protein [Clostridium algidicarnis]MBU3202829.1 hypothetical protein [Clostridium algidicarnis]MBU3210983.1 hypothetical protein [Clostridium algidicarnis]MBU3222509.1 hypothetical protein [Clostridium algidicarnis]